jgi:hypothetical protein
MNTFRMTCPGCLKLIKVDMPRSLKKRRKLVCPKCNKELLAKKDNQIHRLVIAA